MRVKATQPGFYGYRLRGIDDVFELEEDSHFSEKWMEEVPEDKPAPKRKRTSKPAKTDSPQPGEVKADEDAGEE